ncbi:MAG: hypothetical protein QOF48_1263 [Verrucomicrobiota bacterium]
MALLPASSLLAIAPKLNSILPTGAQRGSEIDVRFSGQRLEDTKEIVIYTPGISVVKMGVEKTNAVKATLKIAADCVLGEHQLRLRTATGVSELRTFWVGALPVLAEVEPNNDASQAQKIPLNSTVTGTILSEDVDWFTVHAEKGQRLSVEVEGIRLGRAVFDAAISIHDAAGKILASADDCVLTMQDPIASLMAPATADYLIQLHETSYGGKEDYHYRLHIGSFPRPLVAYPAGGKAGETLSVKFLGDSGGEISQRIELPSVVQEKFGIYASQAGAVAPSPNWLRVSGFPNVLEAAPNQDREHATPTDLQPPLALNGIIAAKGQSDWFRFKAKKGQPLDVNVFARRLRSPLDSVIDVFDAKGGSIASNDDAPGPDSAVKFTPADDGNFFVRIHDQLNQGGPQFVYRVEVTPAEPSLSIKTPEVARNDTQSRQYIAVPRGNRFATLINVKRANFNGDVGFVAQNLPQGVKLIAESMPAKVDSFPLVFEAASDAPVSGRLSDLVATGANHVTGAWRNDIELVQGGNNTAYNSTRVDKLLVVVTEAAPFQIRIVEPKVPLVQGGAMDLRIEAQRQPGFDEPINLKLVWNPPGVTGQSDVTIPKGQNSVLYPLNAKPDAETRSWKIAVQASATVQGGPLFVSSQMAKLEIAPPFLTAKIETSACEPGKSTNIVVKLDQLIAFEGKAIVKLFGLPEKVAVPEMQITKGDKEVVFKIAVDPACPTGSHKNLFCTVAVKRGGEVIPHTIGSGGILRIVPPKRTLAAKSVARNEAGRK